MPLVCLGLSHRTAPAEVRERHTFPTAKMAEALVALRDYEAIVEAAMLSTCGRIEIYAEVTEPLLGVEQLKAFLLAFRHGDITYDIEPYLYTLHDGAAVDHLFHVATGLDSMLLGETEILGQIKSAYHQAQTARSLGPVVHRLVQEALTAGKAARSRTAIGDASVSVATAAVIAAHHAVGPLRDKRVVLVGAGAMGLTAARRLKFEGVSDLVVLNRTHERATELVACLGVGRAAGVGALQAALETADVVICSTGASGFVITAEMIAGALRGRANRPLCLIDIAVPRDVEPLVALFPGITLVDIDQLGATVDVKLETRRRAIPFVEAIVAEHVERFATWYRSRSAIPTIASLAQKAESVRGAEVARLFARCPALGDRERSLVTGMSLTIVSRLLHSAFTKMRETASADQAGGVVQACIVDALFDLHHAGVELDGAPLPPTSAGREVPFGDR